MILEILRKNKAATVQMIGLTPNQTVLQTACISGSDPIRATIDELEAVINTQSITAEEKDLAAHVITVYKNLQSNLLTLKK